MKSLLAAIQFLTTIPVPTYLDKKYFLSSSKWYLCVGLLLGIILAFMDSFFRQIVPGAVASTLTVLSLVILTGGLHLDGLADTADGFLSYQSRDKTLEIMKDSRSGVMAILSVFFVLSLKIILISHINYESIFGILVLLPFLGRFSILLQMNYLPYAREKGFGQMVEVNTLIFWVSFIFVFGVSAFICNFTGAIYVLILIILNISFSVYCFFKIKGYTGDTVGAAVELTEVFFLLMVVVGV